MLALFWVHLKHSLEFLEVPGLLFASLATFNMYIYISETFVWSWELNSDFTEYPNLRSVSEVDKVGL